MDDIDLYGDLEDGGVEVENHGQDGMDAMYGDIINADLGMYIVHCLIALIPTSTMFKYFSFKWHLENGSLKKNNQKVFC